MRLHEIIHKAGGRTIRYSPDVLDWGEFVKLGHMEDNHIAVSMGTEDKIKFISLHKLFLKRPMLQITTTSWNDLLTQMGKLDDIDELIVNLLVPEDGRMDVVGGQPMAVRSNIHSNIQGDVDYYPPHSILGLDIVEHDSNLVLANKGGQHA
jgi:hypothetical protein